MNKYRIVSFPAGVILTECTVARSSLKNGRIFIKTRSGEIYFASQNYREIDLLDDYGSNSKDRSVYAKLAGITVKELDFARKAAKDKVDKANRAYELSKLKRNAAKFGMKLVRAS